MPVLGPPGFCHRVGLINKQTTFSNGENEKKEIKKRFLYFSISFVATKEDKLHCKNEK
jgi:hypothetical protein